MKNGNHPPAWLQLESNQYYRIRLVFERVSHTPMVCASAPSPSTSTSLLSYTSKYGIRVRKLEHFSGAHQPLKIKQKDTDIAISLATDSGHWILSSHRELGTCSHIFILLPSLPPLFSPSKNHILLLLVASKWQVFGKCAHSDWGTWDCCTALKKGLRTLTFCYLLCILAKDLQENIKLKLECF